MRFRSVATPLSDGCLCAWVKPEISDAWLFSAVGTAPAGEGRRHARVELPEGGRAFVKTYNPRSKHSLLRRLRASRAIAEGEGYRAFAAAGIDTPELIAWGEVRRRFMWMRGIVITRLIDGPTVAEDYAARSDADMIIQAAECLARVHQAGLAHGDPRLRNFLVSGETILPFDLCSWGRLDERRRVEDLVKFLGSARTLVDQELADRLLTRYSECAGWRGSDELMKKAAAYAEKERVP